MAYTQYPKLFGADLKTLSHPSGILPRVVCSNPFRSCQKSRAKITKNCGGSINRQRKGKKQGKKCL